MPSWLLLSFQHGAAFTPVAAAYLVLVRCSPVEYAVVFDVSQSGYAGSPSPLISLLIIIAAVLFFLARNYFSGLPYLFACLF